MVLLMIYWAFLAAGFLAGSRMRSAGKSLKALASLMMVTVYGLCFCMGMRMGIDEQVTSNLGRIGLTALLITAACIAGSMLGVFGMRRILHMDRYGRLPDAKAGQAHMGQEEGPAGNNASDGTDVRSTVILLAVVAAGMMLGALVLAGRGEGFSGKFDSASNMAMIILLCILMGLVGLDMGLSGTVIDSLKRAGARVLLMPLAVMTGTMVFGIAACLALGFGFRESAAIPIGFGWYSYAPMVITGAESQYVVAGAVSFMHNVIREVSGIILIPAAARRIGYLEAVSIPGIAAMDVCIPIVSRSCRPDTVIYSFATGVVMCVVTSVGVPLIMGV